MLIELLSFTPFLVAWLGCFWLCRELAARNQISSDWRLSWALASVSWGALVTLVIEGCSFARMLNAAALKAAWVLVDGILFGVAGLLARNRRARAWSDVLVRLKNLCRNSLADWPADAKWMLGGTVAFTAFLFVLAATTPTTNWDSLTYHLPRVMHWVQQQSVEHFATDNTRELEFGPWSAFAFTHLFLLWGDDRLVNLVQWSAMLSSLIVLSFVARHGALFLGKIPATGPAGRFSGARLAAFTCLMVVTLPIGLVESITTQNDYTTAFWFSCLACFTLALFGEPANRWYAVGASLSFALGVLTKVATVLYAAPLLAVAGLWLLSRLRATRALLALVSIFAASFLVLNAAHLLRNDALYGSPIGSKYIMKIERNERISVTGTLSNAIRNLALHANSGIPALTYVVNQTLAAFHRLTGEPLNNPATTYHWGEFSFQQKFRVYDSYASCTYHLGLILVAGVVAACRPRQNLKLLGWAALVVVSFVLFCATLRWQYWHTRLHLVYFLLLAPWVAVILVERFPRWMLGMIAVALFVFAGYCLAKNESRPIFDGKFRRLPREQQYLAVHDPALNQPAMHAADAISAGKCRSVGLKLEFDDAEYPLWVMLRNRGFDGRIDHCYVQSSSARLQDGVPTPCVIITSSDSPPASVSQAYPHLERYGYYTLLWSAKPLRTGNSSSATGAQ